MQTIGGKTIRGLVERMDECCVPSEMTWKSSPSRLPVTGVPAREYLLRRVASQRVASGSVALRSVASKSVCRRASPVEADPRLALAHVFACLKAAAAKSKVSRLLGRTARPSHLSRPSHVWRNALVCRVGSSAGLRLYPRQSVCMSVRQSASGRASAPGNRPN